jgi:hypothetical protein
VAKERQASISSLSLSLFLVSLSLIYIPFDSLCANAKEEEEKVR